MKQWVFEQLKGDELNFAHDIILFQSLNKDKMIEPGHSFYEEGAKRKYWTRKTKGVWIKVFRSRSTRQVLYEIRNSRSAIMQVFLSEEKYNEIKG